MSLERYQGNKKGIINIDDDDVDSHQKSPVHTPGIKASGMPPSPSQKKYHVSKEDSTTDFLCRKVNQVLSHICGTPSTQKAALKVLNDLSKAENNVSKIIVSSKSATGLLAPGMSQEVCMLLLQSKKI
jgi:hypothetical protein